MQNTRPTPDGMTPELMDMFQKVLSGYKPRRGGASDLNDIMRHLATQDPSTVEALMSAVGNAESSRSVDLAAVDYAALPVEKDVFWVVQLLHMGFQDRPGRALDEYVPGSEPVFQIMIYDDKNKYRAAEMNPAPGLPPSDFVLTAIKKAIASPLPPLRAGLPSFLLIARKLSVHLPTLKPFLDSLPKPFTWRLETKEEEEEVASGVHDMNVAGVAQSLAAAEGAKARGNQAVARKDRAQAVAHYTEAVEALYDARAQTPAEADERRIGALLGVCLANRAAAWLLPGAGQDARKALGDAEEAILRDAGYGKAYYRKAKALQLLSEPSKAIDTLCDALGRSGLASEKGLVDLLVELYGGFPDEADALREFCKDKFKNEDGDKRARNVAEFRRRAEEKLKSVLGPDAFIDAL